MEGEKFNNPFIDKVIGIPPEHRNKENAVDKELASHIGEMGSQKIENLELEKTPRDMEILRFAAESVSALLKRYGREKELTVFWDHVHILKPGGTEQFTNGKLRTGGHSSAHAGVLIDRNSSDIEFCLVAFHEFLHLKSFKVLQFIQPNPGEKQRPPKDYRSGFAVTSRDGKETYFNDLEEALVGFFTQEFLNTYVKSNPLFQDELEKLGENLPVVSRQGEMKKLNDLVDELWENNKHEFKSKDDIFNLFIDAQINGHLLKLGRLIEHTFGKGSFRALGEGKDLESDILGS